MTIGLPQLPAIPGEPTWTSARELVFEVLTKLGQRAVGDDFLVTSSAPLLVNGGVSTPLRGSLALSFPVPLASMYGGTGWFNVLTYSADATGSRDCTAAVQRAINACKAAGGGVVYFPHGIYLILGTLTVPIGIVFQGDGREGNLQITNGTTLLLPSDADGFDIVEANATPVLFRDMGFDTVTQLAATSGAFIHCDASVSFPLIVERCKFWHHYVGCLIESGKVFRLTANHFNHGSSSGHDVWMNDIVSHNEGDGTLIGNIFSTSNAANVRFTNGGGLYVQNNKFIGNGTHSLVLDVPNATGLLMIQNNSFEGNQTAASISIVPSGGTFNAIQIANNEFETASGKTAISFAPGASAILSQTKINMNLFRQGAYAISFQPAAAGGVDICDVSANTFSGQTSAAIQLPSTANYVTHLNVGPNQYVQAGTAPYVEGAFDATSGFSPGVETAFVQTSPSTTTANVASTLLGTGRGSLTIPAGRLMVGTRLEMQIRGYISVADGGSAAKTLVLSLGGVTVCTFTTASGLSALNSGFFLNATITCDTTGASGTAWGGFDGSIAGSVNYFRNGTAAATIDTTSALTINVTLNNGNATGTATTTGASVKILD